MLIAPLTRGEQYSHTIFGLSFPKKKMLDFSNFISQICCPNEVLKSYEIMTHVSK